MIRSEYTQLEARHYNLLRHHLEQSYMDLIPDRQSEWDREKIFRKIDMLAIALVDRPRDLPKLAFDISTKTDLSKLVTLLIGLKYRLMKAVMGNLYNDLLNGKTASRKVLMDWIATLSAIQAQLLVQKPLVIH